VAAYDNAVSVVGVGFDIACGNAAIRTDKTVDDLGNTGTQVARRLTNLADEIAETLSFGMGRKNRADDAPVNDPLFEDPAWTAVPAKHRQALQVKARRSWAPSEAATTTSTSSPMRMAHCGWGFTSAAAVLVIPWPRVSSRFRRAGSGVPVRPSAKCCSRWISRWGMTTGT
jgi:hypothetical protein